MTDTVTHEDTSIRARKAGRRRIALQSGRVESITVAGAFVPEKAITWKATRSGGPGGQNVNKVASKVQLRVDLALVEGIDDDARARLVALAGNRLDEHGCFLVASERTRDQAQNLADALEKVRALLAEALIVPKQRRKTRPTRGSVRRRLNDKKQRSATKENRRAGSG